MAFRTSAEYFDDIKNFIDELNKCGKTEASKRMKECYDYFNDNKDDWKMFYRKLLLVKSEFEFKFTEDENKEIDGIIEAAKRVLFSL